MASIRLAARRVRPTASSLLPKAATLRHRTAKARRPQRVVLHMVKHLRLELQAVNAAPPPLQVVPLDKVVPLPLQAATLSLQVVVQPLQVAPLPLQAVVQSLQAVALPLQAVRIPLQLAPRPWPGPQQHTTPRTKTSRVIPRITSTVALLRTTCTHPQAVAAPAWGLPWLQA